MQSPFEIGGATVAPGETRRVELPVARLVTQTRLTLPIVVMHGKREGPRLWLSSAIHGDELNGTEIIRRVLGRVKVERLRGTLVAAPVVNVFGFLAQSRYLPDRRDLNRSFPGTARGSLAARLANLFVTEVVARCTHGIDLHTGSNNRINLPQIRANLDDPVVEHLARSFGAPLMIQAKDIAGSLRETAKKRGIPIIVYEAGEPMRFDENSIALGVVGIVRAMQALGMLRAPKRPPASKSVAVRTTRWLRAGRSGIVHLDVGLHARVEPNQVVAHMHDAIGEAVGEVRSPVPGVVIGHTNNPLVNRGEAVVHIAEIQDYGLATRRPRRKRPRT